MIDRLKNPIEWAYFLDELKDAHEHLGNMLQEIKVDRDYSEIELGIDLGHVYSHLNRAWVRKDLERDLTDDEWRKASQFPDDLVPI